MVAGAGGFIGFVAGAFYGAWEYRAAVQQDLREGGPGDYLPVGLLFWAWAGGILGALVAAILQAVWVRTRRRGYP